MSARAADVAHKIVVGTLIAYTGYGMFHVSSTGSGIISRYFKRHADVDADGGAKANAKAEAALGQSSEKPIAATSGR